MWSFSYGDRIGAQQEQTERMYEFGDYIARRNEKFLVHGPFEPVPAETPTAAPAETPTAAPAVDVEQEVDLSHFLWRFNRGELTCH